jgi:putative membrane protein
LTYLLEHFPIVVWSFFFGLVTASIWLVGRTVKQWNVITVMSFILGAVIAYVITIIPASDGVSEPWYLILCGALAICAMILPGISGSFILLLLGAYSTVLAAVSERELSTIMYVGIGAILGLISFTKALKWIFSNYYSTTIAVLSGFLLGSLNKLWPWKEVLESFTKHEGTAKEEVVVITSINLSPGPEWPVALLCVCAGGVLVLLLERYGNRERV